VITRILVTGATGHVGSRMAGPAAVAGWSVVGTYFSAPGPTAAERLDVRDPDTVRDLIEQVRPDAVIHTATARDDWRVMADGAAHVAVATAAADVRLVHVPSDSVLSGRHNYEETAQPDPVYPYGAASELARVFQTPGGLGDVCVVQVRAAVV
jgi:dTDP-4-dehydrorhamnose reductase